MIPIRIFLDLDDVCNKFTMHALKAVGCPVEAHELNKFLPEWGFDIVKAANALHPTHIFSLESFWESIGQEVWVTAPESDEFKKLLTSCARLVGKENVCILTTPVKDPASLAGKLEWIHAHCPAWMHRQYLMGPQKHLLATNGSLLIDDSDVNVDTFRIYGGQAILIPRPWNSLNGINAKQMLEQMLEKAFKQYFLSAEAKR